MPLDKTSDLNKTVSIIETIKRGHARSQRHADLCQCGQGKKLFRRGATPGHIEIQCQQGRFAAGSSARVRLLHRSTRRLGLTEIGEAYFEHCDRILDELALADSAVHRLHLEPRGTL